MMDEKMLFLVLVVVVLLCDFDFVVVLLRIESDEAPRLHPLQYTRRLLSKLFS